jgi:hypothetical protein
MVLPRGSIHDASGFEQRDFLGLSSPPHGSTSSPHHTVLQYQVTASASVRNSRPPSSQHTGRRLAKLASAKPWPPVVQPHQARTPSRNLPTLKLAVSYTSHLITGGRGGPAGPTTNRQRTAAAVPRPLDAWRFLPSCRATIKCGGIGCIIAVSTSLGGFDCCGR